MSTSYEGCKVNNILRVQIEEFEKFVVGRFVVHEAGDFVEEGQFF